jgi:hypothetical protein
MRNLLLENVEYRIEETPRGVWRRYVYPTGQLFAEFRSHTVVFGMPLLHFTRGICPETGRRVVARGFFAVGRIATGVIAFGQAAAGVVAIGQAAFGLLFCVAQAGAGYVAVGQLAGGLRLGIGQLVTGLTAIGQLGLGKYVLAQIGIGPHLWTPYCADPAAVQHFQELWRSISSFLPGSNV